MAENKHEQRRAVRTRRSDALLWRTRGNGNYLMAWMLERSEDSLAFAWRGSPLPTVGTLVDLHLDTTGVSEEPQCGIVRRVKHVHDDLAVIAVEIVQLRAFPPKSLRAQIPIRNAA